MRLNAAGYAVVERPDLPNLVEVRIGRNLDADERQIVDRLAPGTTADEAVTLLSMMLRSLPPQICGPEVPVAPARGPMKVVTPRRMEGNASVRDGYLGRSRLDSADVFDTMHARAAERYTKACAEAERAGEEHMPRFSPPFTSGQVAMARHYRALVERHASGGMKCVSLEAGRAGGGSGGGFMDAFLHEGEEIRLLRARVGSGSGMPLRRVRPSARGSRSTILDIALVDRVCLHGETLTAVLEAHGWPKKGDHVDRARLCLAAALDRMQCHRDAAARNPLDA